MKSPENETIEPCRVAAGVWFVGRPRPGSAVSGDAFFHVAAKSARLLALADGLGHGPEAKRAADLFCACVCEHAEAAPEEIFARADRVLRNSRGAAAALAAVFPGEGRLRVLSVGNVEVRRLSGGRETRLPSAAGFLGGYRGAFRAQTSVFRPGDLLVMATDGVDPGPRWGSPDVSDPEILCRTLFRLHARDTDDAALAVVLL